MQSVKSNRVPVLSSEAASQTIHDVVSMMAKSTASFRGHRAALNDAAYIKDKQYISPEDEDLDGLSVFDEKYPVFLDEDDLEFMFGNP